MPKWDWEKVVFLNGTDYEVRVNYEWDDKRLRTGCRILQMQADCELDGLRCAVHPKSAEYAAIKREVARIIEDHFHER